MFRVHELHVERFRGVAEPVTLRFGPRYNLILGDNGAGKSNLLELIGMVTRLDFSALASEAFAFSWEASTDAGDRVVGRVRRDLEPVTVREVMAHRFLRRVKWDWRIEFRIGEADPVALVSAGAGEAGEAEDPAAALWTQLPTEMWLDWRLFDWIGARTDEALGSFRALTSPTEFEGRFSSSVIVWAETPTTTTTLIGSGNGPDAWGQAVAAGTNPPLDSAELPWLDAARRDLGARNIQVTLRMQSRRPGSDDTVREIIEFSGCDLQIAFSEHVSVHHDKLSFGQKRLLGLRWHLSERPESPALVDELSNGLHHAWVETLVRELEPRQSFLATQSPLLMDNVWWESAEEAARGIVLCTRDTEHRWRWRQLAPEEAARFYTAWRAGIQQIHEVLRTEGWW